MSFHFKVSLALRSARLPCTLLPCAPLLCVLLACVPARAADPRGVGAPAFRPGDSWVFEETLEKGQNGFDQRIMDLTIERVDDETMEVGVKRDGAPGNYIDQMVGKDWSKRQVIDGQERTTLRPFKFPLDPGQTWSVDFTDRTRRGQVLANRVERNYRATGWEDVTVPAGTYRAMKIEAQGTDTLVADIPSTAVSGAAASPSGGATTVSHAQHGGRQTIVRQIRAELYYVPPIKDFVKVVEEQFNTDNVRISRHTTTLVSFKPGT